MRKLYWIEEDEAGRRWVVMNEHRKLSFGEIRQCLKDAKTNPRNIQLPVYGKCFSQNKGGINLAERCGFVLNRRTMERAVPLLYANLYERHE